jgi:PQQ-dependent dehydrogenase (methanol/ethanol family)
MPASFRCRALTLAALSLPAWLACAQPREIDDAALRAADADSADWLTYGRTYAEQRFSPLRQIDERTVGQLGLVWSVDFGTLRGLEATPLVKAGVMYVTSAWSIVRALDARTGREIWAFDPRVPKDHAKFVCCDVVNRGVALYKGRVYVGTLDGRLIALDAKSGALVWDVRTVPERSPYAITGAPRIANGRVLIGNAGGEYATRGFVSAYDAASGALAWRAYMVPGDPSKPFESEAMRTAAATWSGEWWKGGGGGNVWDAIVYDPELDLVYIGTANGSPWYESLRSEAKGDNLFVSSIVALRARDGSQVWHYQATPGDNWDYDATQPLMLASLTIDGRTRRVVMQGNKNGFFYVIDRETGKLVSARPFTDVTWATGIDSTGRPIESPDARRSAVAITPAVEGAHNWNPMSFSPTTGLVYLGVTEASSFHVVDPDFVPNHNDQTLGNDVRYRGPIPAPTQAPKLGGHLVAWDPVRQREVWRAEHPDPKSGGTLATAGNLVFQGRADGKLRAYRATDGTVLWEFDSGVGIGAPPVTYAVNGTQYLSVLIGWGGPMVLTNRPVGRGKVGPGRLLTFALGGTATLPRVQQAGRPLPSPEYAVNATPEEITEGGALYNRFCFRCHGVNVVSSGALPDLRYTSAATHAMFDTIVRGGARRVQGMPSFAADLTSAQVRLIQAYVLARACG